MWTKMLTKFGFFLLELGAQMLIQIFFGKENRKKLETIVGELALDSTLTSKQKYNRAKKFLDDITDDVPETLKNLAIEAVVSKMTEKASKVIDKV